MTRNKETKYNILVTKHAKLAEKILDGNSDGNITFEELSQFLLSRGYNVKRVRGSHYHFRKEGSQPFNLQVSENGKAKRYQVKQVRDYFNAK